MPELPKRILVQKGAIDAIKEFSNGLGKNFLIVADEVTKSIGAEKIASSLGAKIVLIKDSSLDEVKKIEAEKTDCIISFGGGKVIDVGKLAAHGKKIPFVSFPTACSHDGIASMNASIRENGEYKSFTATAPAGIIADVDILSKSPYRLEASGAADLISNYCSVFDWRLGSQKNGESYSEPIANLALLSAGLVSDNTLQIKRIEDEGIKNLMWGLIFSGISMTLHGSSRPASGAEHMFSHALDKIGKFGLHGEQVGIGTIFFSYLQGQDWQKIRNTLKDLGAPTTIKEVGISQEVFVEAMIKAKDVRKRYTILDEKPLTEKLVLRIVKETKLV